MEGYEKVIQMRKEFVMRGQTADFKSTSAAGNADFEVLNFSGYKPGYAYRLVEFKLFPTTNITALNVEICASITAGKTPADPENPDFNDEGLIATAVWFNMQGSKFSGLVESTINDTFLITQNLILTCTDSQATPINWQCRFVSVKMNNAEEAAANFKQFSISD